MLNPLLSYLKNNEYFLKDNVNIFKYKKIKKFKKPYNFYKPFTILTRRSTKNLKYNLIKPADGTTTKFQIYLFNHTGVNKYKTEDYQKNKIKIKKNRFFKKLFLNKIEHYLKKNYN